MHLFVLVPRLTVYKTGTHEKCTITTIASHTFLHFLPGIRCLQIKYNR